MSDVTRGSLTPEQLTTARSRALWAVHDGWLLFGACLYSAAWLRAKGLIEPAPSYKPDDSVAKRAFVLTDAGKAMLDGRE